MKKILITGGPVHAYLDDVKIITNKFRGKLMCNLVSQFVKYSEENNHVGDDEQVHVTYLCPKSSQQPWWDEFLGGEDTPYLTCVHHSGIDDYMKKVLALAPDMDAVVLGAAVANLIPKNKIEGKFPSHNYKPGDTIPIDFTIAPRIIDHVKKVAPKTLLFGYKLLSGVDYNELVRAAYGVLLESKAVTVFANDAMDLMLKYAVTKERAVHVLHNNDILQWILDRLEENYYTTVTAKTDEISDKMRDARECLNSLLVSQKPSFIEVEEGFIFGAGAIRISNLNSFVTTARGKNELEDYAFVDTVDHATMRVICGTTKKASLNAPLFHYIFYKRPEVIQILHFHHERHDLATLDYATPGTDKDSIREEAAKHPSFNIKGHGCILSYNKIGELIR